MNEQNKPEFLVCVSCMTFNHAPYIVDALNGFTMQETNFPYVCAIVDDASIDGEQEVIKNYLNEHFDLEDQKVVRQEETDDYILTFARHKTNLNCFFAVLYLKYNHYSIKKSRVPYISQWLDNAKYIALCEGDDYWIDCHKLHKQVAFLEKNSDCTMVCNRTKRYSVRQQSFLKDNFCYTQSQYADAKDVVENGGLYISTCSIVYRSEVVVDYPEYCAKCHVGDYPLQIMCAMKGNVYFFDEAMSVYRVENPVSWVGRQKEKQISEKRLQGILSEIRMLQGFKKDYPQHSKAFDVRIYNYLFFNIPKKKLDKKGYQCYLKTFESEIRSFNNKERIRLYLKASKYYPIYVFYIRVKNKLKEII